MGVLGKGKKNCENQQDLEKRERNEGQPDSDITVQQEQQDNICEILINMRMQSKEIIDNDKLKVKVNSILQVKQISNELIQDKNCHSNLIKLGYEQTEHSQPIKISETGTELMDKEVENQTNKLEKEENVTYTTEYMKNNRDSTEKYGRNIRVQHFEEGIKEVVAEEIRTIRTKAKQIEHDDMTKEVSNSQLKKETLVKKGKRRRAKV